MTTSYPLRQIEIDGFRGFRGFTLPALGGINVLVGGNNSGKTTILEAISVVCEPCDPLNWSAVIGRRDPGRTDESQLRSLGFAFHRASPVDEYDQLLDVKCRIGCEGEYGLRSLNIRLREFYGMPDDSVYNTISRSQVIKRYFSESSDSERGMRAAEITHEPKWRDGFLDTKPLRKPLENEYSIVVWEGLPFPRYTQSRGRVRLEHSALAAYSYHQSSSPISILSRKKLFGDEKSMVDLVREFDPDIESIEVASLGGYRPSMYLRHRRLGMMPLSAFGDAVRRSVLLASQITMLNPGGVMLIDEAEAGIHADAQPKFFQWLISAAQQRNIQLFLTTHSLEAVDALLSSMPADASEDGLVVYKLEREEQSVHAKRVAGDLLRRLRFNRGLDIR